MIRKKTLITLYVESSLITFNKFNLRILFGDVCFFLVLYTLQGTNISHLGKRKIIFKSALVGDMLVPRRVIDSITQISTGNLGCFFKIHRNLSDIFHISEDKNSGVLNILLSKTMKPEQSIPTIPYPIIFMIWLQKP